MREDVPVQPETMETSSPRTPRRVSWGAIWAGMFVTVVLQIMLTLLGVACGIHALNPASQPASVQGLSVGAALWLLVTWLISMWVGACVAGRMSGGPRQADGMVHGVVSWAFSTVVILLFLTTLTGALLGSTAALLGGPSGRILSAHWTSPNTAAGSGLPTVSGRGGESQPASRLTAIAQTDPELSAILSRIEVKGGAAQAPADRDQAVNLLVTKHQLSQSEASALINDWKPQLQQAQGGSDQGAAKGGTSGRAAARSVWGTSLWAFIALLFGLAVAAWGGSVGVSAWLPDRRQTVAPAA